MSLYNLVNKCFIEVSSVNDLSKIEKAKSEYDLNNILILYFHYDKNKIISDYENIKYLESKSKMHINFINISNLYTEKLKIIELLNLYPSNKEYKNLKYEVELKNIIEEIKDQITKYKHILEYKG